MKLHPTILATTLLACPAALAQPCPGNPDALGVSRTVEVGTQDGLRVGLKTYPQTLALEKGEVVLTFDDGPMPATTKPILDALKHECVLATFFLVGRNAAASPALARRERDEGHTVGHHTYSHPFVTMRGLSDAAARADIDKGFAADDKAVYGVAGSEPRVPFFRFPGFADTGPLLAWLAQRRIGVFGADLWASDWNDMTPQQTLDLLMSRLDRAGKGVVLLHDTRHQTAAILPQLLRTLKSHGFRIVHLTPGATSPSLETAPEGWRSETEAAIAKVWPSIVAAQQHAARHPDLPLASSATGPQITAGPQNRTAPR